MEIELIGGIRIGIKELQFNPSTESGDQAQFGIPANFTLQDWPTLNLLYKAREHSAKVPQVHSKLLNKRFRRSCAELKWKLGSLYAVKRNTYLIILQNFVLRSIV